MWSPVRPFHLHPLEELPVWRSRHKEQTERRSRLWNIRPDILGCDRTVDGYKLGRSLTSLAVGEPRSDAPYLFLMLQLFRPWGKPADKKHLALSAFEIHRNVGWQDMNKTDELFVYFLNCICSFEVRNALSSKNLSKEVRMRLENPSS